MEKIVKHVSPYFQITLFLGAIALFCIIAYRPICKLTIYDHFPAIAKYSDAQTREKVRMGMHIRHFAKTDMSKGDFIIEGTLWFEFNTQKIPLKSIAQFNFEKGEILSRSEPVITTFGQHTLVEYPLRVAFKSDLDYRAYPVDDHRISLIVGNLALDAALIEFTTDSKAFTFTPDVVIPNFVVCNKSAIAGYVTSRIALAGGEREIQHPRTIFSLNCNHADMRHFINIFLPLLIIFLLTLFAFSFDFTVHTSTVPSIAVAGVPALLAYRFVIESSSPDVGYFMLSDYLFFLFLLLVFLIFFFVTIALHASRKSKQNLIIMLYALMLIGSYILFRIIL